MNATTGRCRTPTTLPALPPEPMRAELRRTPTTLNPRKAVGVDPRRGEAYPDAVVDNLAAMPADSGRNNALNGAAWTLGRWIAAGALQQADVDGRRTRVESVRVALPSLAGRGSTGRAPQCKESESLVLPSETVDDDIDAIDAAEEARLEFLRDAEGRVHWLRIAERIHARR